MGKFEFKHVVAAGSWDHFHKGHEDFLHAAFAKSARVWVGVTAQSMITKKVLAQAIQPYRVRKSKVEDFILKQGWDKRSQVTRLTDIYGPAVTDRSIEAMVITGKTLEGAEKVNRRRRARNLPVLRLIKAPLTKDKDGQEISSERIRAGIISRDGLEYLSPFNGVKALVLPASLRSVFKRPFGKTVTGGRVAQVKRIKKIISNASGSVICVGDVVSKFFMDNKLVANLFVVDFKIERVPTYITLAQLGFSTRQAAVVVRNRPGGIQFQVAKVIRQIFEQLVANQKAPVVVVQGEEDLMVIPVVLTAPLGSVVIYGQPHKGMVWVEVNETKKLETYNLVKKFRKV